MSMQADYEVKLNDVDGGTLKEAIDMMCKELKIKILDKESFHIYNRVKIPVRGTCLKIKGTAYPVDVYVNEKGTITINGDADDLRKVRQYNDRIKQFYEGFELANEFGGEPVYNKEDEKIELMVTV